jgi:hypothetical protein
MLGRIVGVVLVIGLIGAVATAGAVATNALGVGDRFANLVDRVVLIVDPPPDRPIKPTVTVTSPPVAVATAAPPLVATPRPDDAPDGPTGRPPTPAPSPTPTPARVAVDVDIVDRPSAVFASQLTKDWCAVAGVQMTLAVLGLGDTSDRFQKQIASRLPEWESRRDSRDGGWGPAAMVEALAAYGADGYEIRAYKTRGAALRDAARAISVTDAPAILLAWRGAHTWVMTGYRADADPTVFDDAKVSGAYILDPWYPRVSSIWGPSDPAGTYQDADEMKRNFLRWARPEGAYPDRDGRWIVLIPTVPASALG